MYKNLDHGSDCQGLVTGTDETQGNAFCGKHLYKMLATQVKKYFQYIKLTH